MDCVVDCVLMVWWLVVDVGCDCCYCGGVCE